MAGVRVASDKGSMALVVAVLVVCGGGLAAAETLVPAVYVFGDSTVDVGNNVPLPHPYGIDLPHDNHRPTGRASNGYTIADTISMLLGFKESPPAYRSLTPLTNSLILSGYGGVNYASGGSGVFNKTGAKFNSTPMVQQVANFVATKSKMIAYAGGDSAAVERTLSESLFLVSMGSNDMFEYLETLSGDVEASFYSNLGYYYRKYLDDLYALGARRFGIIDVPPIGCVPALRNASATFACNDVANTVANHFNTVPLAIVMWLFKRQSPGVTYSYASAYNLVTNFTADPAAFGFSEAVRPCCGGGRMGVDPWCGLPGSTVCDNRDDYLYWDAAHSSEAAAIKAADLFFNAPEEQGYAKPMNFRKLVTPPPPKSFGGVSSF